MNKIKTPEGGEQWQLTTDEFKDAMQETVRTLIKELGLDKVDLKHEVFPGQDNKEDLAKTKVDRQRKFWRAVVRGDVAALKELQTSYIDDASVQQKRALVEGTPSAGGYLVPDEFLEEVLRLIPEYGDARKLCRVIPMKTDALKIPKVTTIGITAYWVGEGSQITASQPVFGEVPLAAKKPAVIIPATSELLEDTDLLLALLQEMSAEQLAYAEDNQLFNGTGSSPAITGLFVSTNVTRVIMGSGKTSLADLTFEDILDVENGVASAYLRNAQWIMHRQAWKYCRRIKDDSGQYLYVRLEAKFDEYPKLTNETAVNNPTTANKGQICLGDLRKSHVFGDRKLMTVKILSEGTVGSDNLGEKDMVAFRFIERVDIQEAQPTAIVVLWTAAA